MNYTSCILALQLCVLLGSSTYCCQVSCIEEIDNLKDYFNASTSDVPDGRYLFRDILKNWKEDSDKKIIQSQIVSFYFKLFNNYKDNQIIQTSMENIKANMVSMFFNSTNRSSDSKREDFEKLMDIQVNDLKVQRKAISELQSVMSDLSSRSNLRKRRRSQIQIQGRRASK
ncbi:interferon gamma [Talpa occidentalis]|uniref:interferon gamma n=1 Tax=Talpa occidentalis TaxID=50954 RepID=UPI00188EAEC0|nr:interferon gamma [Talpa occidentalis]